MTTPINMLAIALAKGSFEVCAVALDACAIRIIGAGSRSPTAWCRIAHTRRNQGLIRWPLWAA